MDNTDGTRELKLNGEELQRINRSAPSGGAAYLTLTRARYQIGALSAAP
jgi:hypothetical protein